MLPTLREVLALPALRSAAIEVITGEPDQVQVRWIHSSEVYEMGGLLAGGELLLTTGLGLHSRNANQLTAYVDQLAEAGCVALALELGRSYFSVPEAMITAARRRGMVFLVLRSVVPFERVIEDFHELMFRRRTVGDVSSLAELVAVVQHGQGLRSLLDATARIAGCRAEVRDVDDRVIEQSAIAVAGYDDADVQAPIRGPHGVLGRLLLYGPPGERLSSIANEAGVAVALELGRHLEAGERPTTLGVLVDDLLSGTAMSHREVGDRLTAAGLGTRPTVVVAVLDVQVRRNMLSRLRELAETLFGSGLAAAVGRQTVLLVSRPGSESPQDTRQLFERLHERITEQIGQPRLVAVSSAVTDLSTLAGAVHEARDVLRLARRAGRAPSVILSRDVAIERVLEAAGPTAVSALIEQQIGALVAYDTASSADLVRTLDAYIAAGGSKSRAAEALSIRRQTLYSRLNRIERLLAVDMANPAGLNALAIAILAWRLRAGVDPQTAFERRLPGS